MKSERKLTMEGASFSDIFAAVEFFDWPAYKNALGPAAVLRGWDGTSVHLSRYVGVRPIGRRFMYATFTPKAVEAIQANFIGSSPDTMNVGIVVRDDGTALITCNNSLIIGGQWLALVPVSQLPLEIHPARSRDAWTLTKTHGLTDEGRVALAADLDDVANEETAPDGPTAWRQLAGAEMRAAVEAEFLRRIGGKKNLVKYVDSLLAGQRRRGGA